MKAIKTIRPTYRKDDNDKGTAWTVIPKVTLEENTNAFFKELGDKWSEVIYADAKIIHILYHK